MNKPDSGRESAGRTMGARAARQKGKRGGLSLRGAVLQTVCL